MFEIKVMSKEKKMTKEVLHSFPVYFSDLKPGDLYSSYCGRKYIADEPPTPSEAQEIMSNTSQYTRCKKCEKEKAKRK